MFEHDDPDSVVERRIRQAMEAGEFDDLPGAGGPLPDAGRSYEPNWWVRRWVERNGLTDRRDPAPRE